MPHQTGPQVAVILERIEHIAKVLDDLKPLTTLAATLQRDQQYLSDSLKQLHTVAEIRGAALHAVDKRVVILERWHKFMVALPSVLLTVLIAASGYVKSYLDSMGEFREDVKHRVTAIEFIINSLNFEKAMAKDNTKPAAEGKK